MAATGDELVTLSQLKNAIEKSQPDMTGVVKVVTGQGSTPYLTTGGVTVPAIYLTDSIPDSGDPESYAIIHTGIGYALSTFFGSGDTANACIGVSGGTAILTMNNKSAYSMTDAISDSPAGEALVTDKAVADYVDAHGGGGATMLWSGSSTSTVTIDSLQDYSLIVCLLYDFDGGGNRTFAIGAPNGQRYLPPSNVAATPIIIGPTIVSAGSFQLNRVYGIK